MAPSPGRRGAPLPGRPACKGPLLPPGRGLRGQRRAGRLPPERLGSRAGSTGPADARAPRRPQQVLRGAPRPAPSPPGPGRYLQRRRPAPGQTQAELARRTHRRTPQAGDRGPAGARPEGRAQAAPRARGPPARARPPDQPSGPRVLPATRPPPSPGSHRRRARLRARPRTRGFWSLRLAVRLAPPPLPPRCQGNPSDACPGPEALGGAEAAPGRGRWGLGAADHGAPE